MGFFNKLFGRRKRDAAVEVKSPNGRLVAKFLLENGRTNYELRKDDKVILRKSRLGISLLGTRDFGEGLELVRDHSRSLNETWDTTWGEERTIRNHYNETAFYLAEFATPRRLITIRFRVFDDGIAFRYEIPAQNFAKYIVVSDELTEFVVDTNSYSWSIPAFQPDRYEYNYERHTIHELQGSVHTPLTIETPSNHHISIHEAALYNYGSMTIKPVEGRLKADITPLSDGMRAYVDLPFSTPWRTVIVGHDAKDLTMSRMTLNLNDPPKGDFSWAKPIKFMGIWWAMFVGEFTWAPGERHGATTENAIKYIDACKRLGLPALLIEGWNDGWEGDWLENGKFNKFMVPAPDFNPRIVADYAHQQGIQLIGHHETVGFVDNYESQIEQSYQFMKDHHLHYVKSGYAGTKMFINGQREFHHSQLGVNHYQKAVELAAKYQICLDVHEPIKGTGIERTWPNLLTREGARGQEYEGGALSPSHACILPFTRLLAGGMDYTPGIFDVVNFTKRIASTLSRQLAYYVTIYSAMHMAADRPNFYEEVYPAAFKFIRDVPVDWDKTIPLLAEIGSYFVVARKDRHTPNWYIGGVTNEQAHRVDLYLDFLDPDAQYIAEIYRDSDDAHYRDNQTGQVIEQKNVRQGERFSIYMAPGGGFAIRLYKP
jgi:alpha-glucosidase